MPVEFRTIDPQSTWQIFPRHPAGADYPDLSAALAKRMRAGIEQYGVMLRPVVLKRESGGMCVLDGWQMYQACIAAGVKPEFVELVSGIDPKEFVEIKNDCRRHESGEDKKRRIAARRQQIKADVVNGMPIKEAAKKAGVDRATVFRDLKAIPLCDRCRQKGASGEDCATCQLLRMDWKEKPKAPVVALPTPGPTLDANFVIVPEHALEAFLVGAEIGHICHEMDAIVKRLVQVINGKVGSRAISATAAQRLADVRQHLWQSRATHVCAYCQGSHKEDCTACRGQGWQSAAAFAQAPKEFQDAMRKMGARNVPI